MNRQYPKGQIIFFPDDRCTKLYRVKSGAVKIYFIDDDGNEHIIDIRSRGHIFTACAVLPKCQEVGFFFTAMMDTEITEVTNFGDDILVEMAELYVEARDRIASLMLKTAKERVLAAKDYARSHGITEPTHQTLAELSGTTRETVTNAQKE